ncbi:MAG: DUF3159 domain-containing protein [Acidimicrobiia bacterium]|nr:DUF3159 domain-containing protein [Acidimicrobiia bacterium]MDH4306171.1 DUF3159 domain-containing protein [Acidimicrobiia bacterium]MDH5292083.1 DUF3159 domain-containing protein [Acidimicrobiia bacterium]
MAMLSEVLSELRSLVAGRGGIADGILPPLVFVIVNALFGVTAAAWTAMGTALVIVAWRLARRAELRYALSGVIGTLAATLLAVRSGRAETYFLPGIVSGAMTTVALLVSLVLKRPAAAYASWVTRQWPLDWYWHPRVRPAYTAATVLWVAYFGVRTAVTWWLFQGGQTEALAVVRVVSGWPGLLALLVATYVLGRNRLEALGGPSVDEFVEERPPPWQGQPTGF